VRAQVVPIAASALSEPSTGWLNPMRSWLTLAPGADASTPTVTGTGAGGVDGGVTDVWPTDNVDVPLTPVNVKPVSPVVWS